MEIGNHVMHGQYDWMNDASLNSQTYEWDIVYDGWFLRQTHGSSNLEGSRVTRRSRRRSTRSAHAMACTTTPAVSRVG